MEARLADEASMSSTSTSTSQSTQSTPLISIFSVKAGYIVAITRSARLLSFCSSYSHSCSHSPPISFVTGLLDLEQSSKYKISMYTLAAQIGLPASFVDLRHEATHGEMPGLEELRRACGKALGWLWDEYWDSISVTTPVSKTGDGVVGEGMVKWRSSGGGGDGVEGEGGGDGEAKTENQTENENENEDAFVRWKGLWRETPIGVVR